MSFFNSFKAVLLCGILVSLWSVGCSRSSNTSAKAESESAAQTTDGAPIAGVATIDVNQIALESGRLAQINLTLDKKESELKLILEGVRKIHIDELTSIEKKYGKEPSETEKKEISKLRSEQTNEYSRRWQETRLQLSSLKQKLDEQFLANVQPIAKSVAEEKGLSVVIRKENVFCLVDQFDITSDVAKKFLKSFPKPKEQPAATVAKMPTHGGSFVPRQQ